MRNKRKSKHSTEQESEYQKFFEDVLERLRETGDIDVVHETVKDVDHAKPTVIPFPYGGKRYNDWVSS